MRRRLVRCGSADGDALGTPTPFVMSDEQHLHHLHQVSFFFHNTRRSLIYSLANTVAVASRAKLIIQTAAPRTRFP
jgi:hypothetical protein